MASSIILFLSLSCSMVAVLSMNECLIGETFWCSTFQNAVACSAVEFCSSSAWKTENLDKEVATGNDCQKCLNTLTIMNEFQQDKDKKDLIKSKASKSICSAVEADKILCGAILSQPIEELFNSLSSENDLLGRCRASGYCGSGKRIIPQRSSFSSPVNSFWCKFCIKAFDEVKKAIGSSPTRDKVKEELAKTCGHVPKIARDECEKLIKEFADKLIDLLLEKASSEKICRTIHACFAQICANGDSVEVSSQCETCEVVVRLLEELSEGNSSVLRSTFPQSCPMLPCKYQNSCFTFQENHGESLIQHMKEFVPTDKICSMLNVCSVSENQGASFKCIAGPNFWCSSPMNAKFCEAEEHCKKYVWA